jgi:hypothetical protein
LGVAERVAVGVAVDVALDGDPEFVNNVFYN